MNPQPDTVVITAECLCKSHKFHIEVPTSKIPLQCNVCHCDSCRHSTGALFVIETTWPQPRENVDISGLQRYQFSANITYRFCGTCSTLMFYESRRYPSKLGVFYGPLKNIDVDLIELTKNIYVGDTADGGASVWFRKPNADGKEIPRYREIAEDGKISWDWPQVPSLLGHQEKRRKESIPIWCHCKGINLLLHHKNDTAKDRGESPWFIEPRTNNPIARFTAGDSCHPYSAIEIVNWTFADFANISQVDGSAFQKTAAELKAAVDAGDSTVGTLAYYRSSSEVQRYFCKVCSASAFYACNDRPNFMSVAIGLLEASDGARAEAYLSWNFEDILAGFDDSTGGWRARLIERVQSDAEDYQIARNQL